MNARPDYQHFTPGGLRHRPKRKPVHTAAELAAEFGVSAISLGTRMALDPNGPRPVLKLRIATYYDPVEVRAWWQAHKGANE